MEKEPSGVYSGTVTVNFLFLVVVVRMPHSVFSFNNFHLIFVMKARQGLNTGVRKLS